MTRRGYYDFQCYACGKVELRYCNSRKCHKCGGTIYRLDDPPTLPLQKIGQGMTLLIEGLLEQRAHVPHMPPLSIDVMQGPDPWPLFFTTVGNEWRCWGADDQDPGEAIAEAVAEAVGHLSDPEKHYIPDPIHAEQVDIACAAFYETNPPSSGAPSWRHAIEHPDEVAPTHVDNQDLVAHYRRRMKAALLALLSFSRYGYEAPKNAEHWRGQDREVATEEEEIMNPEELIAALKPLAGHWCRMTSPGPPVPFVMDFPVADILQVEPAPKPVDIDDTRSAYGCDVVIWTGRFVEGSDVPSGWALPSSKVAEATWDAVGVKLRKVRARRSVRIKILDDKDARFHDRARHPDGHVGLCWCEECRQHPRGCRYVESS